MAKPLDRGSLVQRTSSLATAPMGDEVAMVDLDSGRQFVLDPLAGLIWERLEQPIRVADLEAELAETYDVSRDRCAADILDFLGQLETKGLLVVL